MHFYYRIAIISSTVKLGDVWFVVHNSTGAAAVAGGALGFSILNPNGTVAAQCAVSGGTMSMSSGWTYEHGTTGSAPLNTTDIIVIDMGTTSPFGQHLEFTGHGTGDYGGTTGNLALA
ncbi:MAG: hypothetical protein WB809_05040 [Thermoplasmata archaeon]